jgi:hypothetical protein
MKSPKRKLTPAPPAPRARATTKKASPSAKFTAIKPATAITAKASRKISTVPSGANTAESIDAACIRHVLVNFAIYDSEGLKQRSDALVPEHKKLIKSCLKAINKQKITAAEKKAIRDFVKAEQLP